VLENARKLAGSRVAPAGKRARFKAADDEGKAGAEEATYEDFFGAKEGEDGEEEGDDDLEDGGALFCWQPLFSMPVPIVGYACACQALEALPQCRVQAASVEGSRSFFLLADGMLEGGEDEEDEMEEGLLGHPEDAHGSAAAGAPAVPLIYSFLDFRLQLLRSPTCLGEHDL
jgi:hypothetical protein